MVTICHDYFCNSSVYTFQGTYANFNDIRINECDKTDKKGEGERERNERRVNAVTHGEKNVFQLGTFLDDVVDNENNA